LDRIGSKCSRLLYFAIGLQHQGESSSYVVVTSFCGRGERIYPAMEFSAVYKSRVCHKESSLFFKKAIHSSVKQFSPSNRRKIPQPNHAIRYQHQKGCFGRRKCSSPFIRWLILSTIGIRKSGCCHPERTPQVGSLRYHGLESRIKHPQVPRRSESRESRLHKPRITYKGARRAGCFGLSGSHTGSAKPEDADRCSGRSWRQENHSL
jgi:hypothetical protein